MRLYACKPAFKSQQRLYFITVTQPKQKPKNSNDKKYLNGNEIYKLF